ncbi:MAG: GTPase HflX [Polyangiaceae bacterium]
MATAELVRSLVEASVEAGRQVGALVHRSGQVDYVVVGDAGKLMLPDIGRLRAAEGRFRGLRLIHTHVRGEPLTKDDLVDLVRLRLDVVCAIQMAPSGEPRGAMYAHNVPSVDHAGASLDDEEATPYRQIGPISIQEATHVNVGALVRDLEAEFASVSKSRAVKAKDGRAILVHVFVKGKDEHVEESVKELRELARTAGLDVADAIVQGRDKLDPKFVMGRGKLDDVVVRSAMVDAETLIFDRNLTPAQAAAIAKTTDLKVIDRSQLILDIFAQRAEGADGKLQVELAQLKYSLPRLGTKDDSLSRLTGGIGGRGPGETKLEIGKRRAKDRVKHLEDQLKKLGKQRAQRRRRRTRTDIPTIAIVGYTNAGKSTLLNTLTASDVLAEDKLFATLDTRSRSLRVGWAGYGEREVVITDTVGFIRDLPKDLFAAFRATFEEAADADLLVHVVDASDPALDQHIATTNKVLSDLKLDAIPCIVVMNKVDLLDPLEKQVRMRSHPDAVALSATDRASTKPLLARIAKDLHERWDAAAKGPVLSPEDAVEDAEVAAPGADQGLADDARGSDEGESDPDEATTLDQMLAAAGKRAKKSASRST